MTSNGARRPSENLTSGEYAALVALLALALIGTALFLSWSLEQRGLLAPDTTPRVRRSGAADPAPAPGDGPVAL